MEDFLDDDDDADHPDPLEGNIPSGETNHNERPKEEENRWRAVEALAGITSPHPDESPRGGGPTSPFAHPSLEEYAASLSGGTALVLPYIPRIHHAFQQLVQQVQREKDGNGRAASSAWDQKVEEEEAMAREGMDGRRSRGDPLVSRSSASSRLLNLSEYEVVQAVEAKLQETMSTVRFLRQHCRDEEANDDEKAQEPSHPTTPHDVPHTLDETIARLMAEATSIETLVPRLVHLVPTPAWRGEPFHTRPSSSDAGQREREGSMYDPSHPLLADRRSFVEDLRYGEGEESTFIDPMLAHVYPLSLVARTTSGGSVGPGAFLPTTTTTIGCGGSERAPVEPNAREKIRNYQSQYQRLQRQERVRHQERHKRALLWKGLHGRTNAAAATSASSASAALTWEREKVRRRAEAGGTRRPSEGRPARVHAATLPMDTSRASTMLLSDVLSNWNKSKGLLNVERVTDVQLVKPEGYFSTKYSSVRKRREEAAVHRLLAWQHRRPNEMPASPYSPPRAPSRGGEHSRRSLSHRTSSVVSSKDVEDMDHLVRKRMNRQHVLKSKAIKGDGGEKGDIDTRSYATEDDDDEEEAMETTSTAGLMAWYRAKTNATGRGVHGGGGGMAAAPVLYRFRDQQPSRGQAEEEGSGGGGWSSPLRHAVHGGPLSSTLRGIEDTVPTVTVGELTDEAMTAAGALLPPLVLPSSASLSTTFSPTETSGNPDASGHPVEALFQLQEEEVLAQQEALAETHDTSASVGSVWWMSTSHPGESATDEHEEEEEEEEEGKKKRVDDEKEAGKAEKDAPHPSHSPSPRTHSSSHARPRTWREGAKSAVLEQLSLYVKGKSHKGKPNVLPPEAFQHVASLLLDRATEAVSQQMNISLQLESNNRTVPFTKQMAEKLKKSVDTYVYRHYIAPLASHSDASRKNASTSSRSQRALPPPATSASRSRHSSAPSSISTD